MALDLMKCAVPVLVLLAAASCIECPSDRLHTLADYRQTLPENDFKELTRKKVLTVSEACRTALKGNPDYRSACRAVAAAKYRYYRSLSAYLPEADFRASAGQSLRRSHDLLNPPAGIMPRENVWNGQLGLYASLLIFDGLEREFSVMIARREEKISRELTRNSRRLLIRGVACAYYDAVLAKEMQRIAEADLSFQLSSLRQAENRYSNGLVSKADVLNFRILVNAAKSAILTARYRGKTARNSLCALMGYPQNDLPDDLELSPLDEKGGGYYPGLEYCLEQAAANRPDLRAAALLLDIAVFRKWQSYSGFLPTVRAVTGLEFSAASSQYGGYQVNSSHHNTLDFSYGFTGEWNLFRGFATVNLVRERRVLEDLAKLHLDNMFLQAVTEVKDAYANYRNAKGQVELAKATLNQVYEQRALVQSAFWCGRDTVTRLNGAQSAVVESESRLAIALIELRRAEIQLNAAMNLEKIPVDP